MDAEERAALVELNDELDYTEMADNEHAVMLSGGYRQLPFDMPAYLKVERLMAPSSRGDMSTAQGLSGHRLTVEAFTTCGDIVIELRRSPKSVKMFAQGEMIWEWEEEPPARKKPVAKKAAVKKAVSKKAAVKKAVSKKAAAKKLATKKAAVKKTEQVLEPDDEIIWED